MENRHEGDPGDEQPEQKPPVNPFEQDAAEVGGPLESFQPTAPVLPWEISLNSFSWFVDTLPSGDVVLTFVPAQATPQGMAFMPPGFAVRIPAKVWPRFQEHVAAGKVPPPSKIERVGADALPGIKPG